MSHRLIITTTIHFDFSPFSSLLFHASFDFLLLVQVLIDWFQIDRQNHHSSIIQKYQTSITLNNFTHQEPIRDANFNTFWGKIPPAPNTNWENVQRCISSCSSEDSRSLDVTGSEDEGGGGEGWRRVLRPVPRFPAYTPVTNPLYGYSGYDTSHFYFS